MSIGKDAHDFLKTCGDRLYNLGLVESRGADCTVYQLLGPSRRCWHSYLECRPTGSSPISWTEFSEAFMARFISRSIRG